MTNNECFRVPVEFLEDGFTVLEHRGFEVPTSMLSKSKEIVINTLPEKELKELAVRFKEVFLLIQREWNDN